MVEPDTPTTRSTAIAVTLAVVWGLGACSSAPEPELGERKTEAMEQIERTKEAAGQGTSAELPASSTDPEAVASAAQVATGPSSSPAVDPTEPVRFGAKSADGEAESEPTLFEASQAERLRRQQAPTMKPSLVITDENLQEYAKGGQLTELITERDPEEDDSASGSPIRPASAASQEDYWRTRARDSRLAWRAAADRVTELEKDVAQLRFDFYAQDDPSYRDGEIKPAWDRAVVELAQARMRADDLETQVERVLSEGLDAGALPGWLREGIDFEPEELEVDDDEDDISTAEVIEPPILEDPPR